MWAFEIQELNQKYTPSETSIPPLLTDSHHQEYDLYFFVGDPYKPSFATGILGGGDNPTYIHTPSIPKLNSSSQPVGEEYVSTCVSVAKPRCLNSRHCLVLKVRHFQQWMVRPGWQNSKQNLNMKHLPTVPKEDLEPNSKVRNNDHNFFLVYVTFSFQS